MEENSSVESRESRRHSRKLSPNQRVGRFLLGLGLLGAAAAGILLAKSVEETPRAVSTPAEQAAQSDSGDLFAAGFIVTIADLGVVTLGAALASGTMEVSITKIKEESESEV